MNYLKFIFSLLILTMFFIMSSYVFTYHHEAVHKQICKYAGGEITDYEMNFVWTTLDFTGEVRCENIKEENYDIFLDNWMETEVVGYHLNAMRHSFFFLALAFLIIKEVSKNETNRQKNAK